MIKPMKSRYFLGVRLWLPRILGRLKLYMFVMSLVLFTLYGIGNFQSFADTTLFILIRIMNLYFYSFLVLAVSDILVYAFLAKDSAVRRILFYTRSLVSLGLIGALYLIINLLSAFFSGI